MLKLGGQNIKGLRLGEKEIKKACLGGDLIFGSEGPPGLPDGYTELEYISTVNFTGIKVDVPMSTGKSRIVLDTALQESVTAYYAFIFCGSNPYSGGTAINLMQNRSRSQFSYLAGYITANPTTISYTAEIGKKISIDMDLPNKTLKMGNKTYLINTTATDGNLQSFTFGMNGSTQNIHTSAGLKQHIYSAQIYEDGTLTGSFVPCKDGSGKVGLFNLITQTFCVNMNTNINPSEPGAGPAV